MKIAAAAYPLDFFDDWSGYEAKLTAWVAEAAGQGAELLVFPEYAAMELASLGGREVAADQDRALRQVSDLAPRAAVLQADLAQRFGVWIVAGSGPVFEGNMPVNRAAVFGPEGSVGHQDKQIMTRWERDPWEIQPGNALQLFDLGSVPAGITICYDSEFPLLSRNLAERGAKLILAPSCTETEWGHSRVRIGARARALENQCVTVLSQIVGQADWCHGVEDSYGRAGIYGPPDKGFPPTGIIAETAPNQPAWALADVDFASVDAARADGQVLTFQHWQEQASRLKTPDADQ